LRVGGLLVEAQGLRGDGSYATELDFGGAKEFVDGVYVVGGGSEIEKIGDGFERIVDLVSDGAGEASDDSEFFTLNQRLFDSPLLRDLKRRGGNSLHRAIGRVNRKIADRPVTIIVWIRNERAFERIVDHGFAANDLIEKFLEAFDGSHLGERATDDLFGLQSEEFCLTVIESEIAIVLDVEEREADGSGSIDGLELCMLALCFRGLATEFFAIEALRGDVAEEDHDAVVSRIALHTEPDIQRLRIEGFELSRLTELHAAAVVGNVGRVVVNDGGKTFEEIGADEFATFAD